MTSASTVFPGSLLCVPACERSRGVVFLGDASSRPAPAPASRQRAARSGGAERGPSLDAPSVEFYRALCRAGGVSAKRYRESILARRQSACLRALRAATPSDGARAVHTDPVGARHAFRAVMIGVTSFFRDTPVFDALRGAMPSAATAAGVRALSVGCSDGSELYSLAMILDEAGLLERSSLWGVDCRPDAIAAAVEGIYPALHVAGVPAEVRARSFVPVEGRRRAGQGAGRASLTQVADRLRARCAWTVADAFDLGGVEGLPRAFDVILCRNLAIYLTPESSTELWALLLERLRPGGLLVVGKAERPSLEVCDSLAKIHPCIYQRRPLRDDA